MTKSQLQQRAFAVMNRLNELGFTKNGNPMVIDQAYELVAAEENLKNQHVLRTKLDPEVPLALIPQYPEECEGTDFLVAEHATGVWLDFGALTVHACRGSYATTGKRDNGLRVFVYDKDDLDTCLDQLTIPSSLHRKVDANMARMLEILERGGYRFEQEPGLSTWIATLDGYVQFTTLPDGKEVVVRFNDQMDAVIQTWQAVERQARKSNAASKKSWGAMPIGDREAKVAEYLQSVGWSPDLIPQLKAAGYRICKSDFKRPFWEFEGTSEASEDFETEEQAWKDAWRHSKGKFIKLESNENIPHVSNEDWSSSENPEVEEQAPQTEMQAAIQKLVDTWAEGDLWGEHPYYDRESWRYEVSNEDTNLGYWEWVVHQIEGNGGEDEHCACGTPLNDGEGWDGKCGDCADKAEAATEVAEELDRKTYTAYAFAIGALSREQLEDEAADQGMSYSEYDGMPSDELRAELLSRYDEAVEAAAEQALTDHLAQVGNIQLVSSSDWEESEWNHQNIMTTMLTLSDKEKPKKQPKQASFTVKLEGNVVVSTELSYY